MRFMIIVKATSESEAGVMPTEEQIGQTAEYHEELARAGVLLDGSGLQASSKGWRIAYNGDDRTTIDGPFAETKELIAGYTQIQTTTREAALEWSRRYPNPAGRGRVAEIEVRQLFELDDFEPGPAIDRMRELDRLSDG